MWRSFVLAALLLMVSLSQAMGREDACVADFNARVEEKRVAGVPEKHLPRLYLPDSDPKDTVIIFTHGIFESPYFFKGVNQIFQEQGFVSLSILLPGHWQGDWSSMMNVTHRDWINEIAENVRIAQCFGRKIIFAGHSLGGILSIDASLRYPDQTAGVMLWAPAVEMKTLPVLGGILGGLLHLNGNLVMGEANLDETPLYAPNAAKQVRNTITHVRDFHGEGQMKAVYAQIVAPTFLAYAENDPAVSVGELTRAAYSIKGLSAENTIYFPAKTGVWHGNITKAKGDAYKRKPKDYNPKWEGMKQYVEQFLRKNF